MILALLLGCGALRAPPVPALSQELEVRSAWLLSLDQPVRVQLELEVQPTGLYLGEVAWSLAAPEQPELPPVDATPKSTVPTETPLGLVGGLQRLEVSAQVADTEGLAALSEAPKLAISGTIWYRKRPSGPLLALPFTEPLAQVPDPAESP